MVPMNWNERIEIEKTDIIETCEEELGHLNKDFFHVRWKLSMNQNNEKQHYWKRGH